MQSLISDDHRFEMDEMCYEKKDLIMFTTPKGHEKIWPP